MTTDPQLERIVRSWLEPGLTTLTDDVLDAVMNQLPATPQRRRWSPARRVSDMSAFAKFAVAAAAVLAVALVGYNLLAPGGASGLPSGLPEPLARGPRRAPWPRSADEHHPLRLRCRAL